MLVVYVYELSKVVELYLLETTFSCGINLLVAVPTSLRSVWISNLYPSGHNIELVTLGACQWRLEFKELFVVYRNQERIAQEEEVTAKVRRTVLRK